jgi:hypothetical protein
MDYTIMVWVEASNRWMRASSKTYSTVPEAIRNVPSDFKYRIVLSNVVHYLDEYSPNLEAKDGDL